MNGRPPRLGDSARSRARPRSSRRPAPSARARRCLLAAAQAARRRHDAQRPRGPAAPCSTCCRRDARRLGSSRSAGSTSTRKGSCCSPTTGALAQRLLHPSFESEKEYVVDVRGAPPTTRCGGSPRASPSSPASRPHRARARRPARRRPRPDGARARGAARGPQAPAPPRSRTPSATPSAPGARAHRTAPPRRPRAGRGAPALRRPSGARSSATRAPSSRHGAQLRAGSRGPGAESPAPVEELERTAESSPNLVDFASLFRSSMGEAKAGVPMLLRWLRSAARRRVPLCFALPLLPRRSPSPASAPTAACSSSSSESQVPCRRRRRWSPHEMPPIRPQYLPKPLHLAGLQRDPGPQQSRTT